MTILELDLNIHKPHGKSQRNIYEKFSDLYGRLLYDLHLLECTVVLYYGG